MNDDNNVLFLLDTLEPLGGAEKIAIDIATGLKTATRFKPIVCSTRYGGAFEEKLNKSNIPFVLLERNRRYEFHKFKKLIKLIKDKSIKIIHSHQLGSNFWGAIIGKISRGPIIIAQNQGQSYDNWKNVFIDKITSSLCDRIIFVSEYEKHIFLDKVGCPSTKGVIINNAIDLSIYKPYIQPEIRRSFGLSISNHVVGIVGGFRPEKNHQTFLLAANEVLKLDNKVRFLLVGEGAEKKKMEKLASRLGIQKNCLFTGFRNDIPNIVSIIDIGCLTSVREGLPVALLEYMASSKAIVSTNVGGVPEVVKHGVNGFLVPSRNYKALAKKILILLYNRNLRIKMGKEGFQILKKNFTLEKMIEKIEDLYSNLIQSKRTLII
ncbi:glycosyltransferase family 4 protein [Desulfobacterota bacterium AH_259_B03_O07]|nr:glycosyltransferase family 4 protein [Desulfobacterota bacterium AH_259_B03_O07]